jgi:YggT family protein
VYAYAYFVNALAQVLNMVLYFYFWVVIIAAVMSWVEPNPYNPIVRAIYSLTEPVFDWVRRHLPVSFGGIDFSPMIVVLGIVFLQNFLVPTLREMALH